MSIQDSPRTNILHDSDRINRDQNDQQTSGRYPQKKRPASSNPYVASSLLHKRAKNAKFQNLKRLSINVEDLEPENITEP